MEPCRQITPFFDHNVASALSDALAVARDHCRRLGWHRYDTIALRLEGSILSVAIVSMEDCGATVLDFKIDVKRR